MLIIKSSTNCLIMLRVCDSHHAIVLCRDSLPLPAEVDDLGCQADDENDEKAGLRPEEEW